MFPDCRLSLAGNYAEDGATDNAYAEVLGLEAVYRKASMLSEVPISSMGGHDQ
jgi:hypothetical protein